MGTCLDKTTLTALAEGKLAGAEAATAEAHIEKCRRCAEALAQLPVNNDLVERLRELERVRKEAGPALSDLNEVVQRVSTTLFGRKPAE